MRTDRFLLFAVGALPAALQAQARDGITATTEHSHLVGETPGVYPIQFWADGTTADVFRGLRAAVDAAR